MTTALATSATTQLATSWIFFGNRRFAVPK